MLDVAIFLHVREISQVKDDNTAQAYVSLLLPGFMQARLSTNYR
jgi:hypothetical protein